MKAKEQDLLYYLFQHQDQYLTSQELSKQLSLSERTVRTYIRNMEHCIKEHGAEICAKQGFGYQLHLIRPLQFELFLNDQRIQTVGSCDSKTALETSLDRQTYILNKLLIEDERVYLDDLADELYISRSTLTKDLNIIKDLLKPYQLSFISKPSYGTWIKGEESDKRSFIMNYFFRGSRYNTVQEYMDHTSYFDDIPTECFILIILEECRRHGIKLSDVMIQNILMHLTLSIKRMEKGLELKQFPLEPDVLDSVAYHTAQHILERLSAETRITFPKEEIAYLTLHLGAKNNHPCVDPCKMQQELEEALQELLRSMEEELQIPFSEDSILKNCLLEHLRPMMVRIKEGIEMENPLTEQILLEHEEAFTITKTYMSQLPVLSDHVVSDDEWAYLTLHFMAAMERLRERNKLQVLVICSTGMGSAQLLKCRIEKAFQDDLHVVSEMGYYEMNKQVLEGIDLIISSVNLDSVIFGIPFLHVSVFLSEQDRQKIQAFIETANRKQAAENCSEKELSLKEKKEVFESYIQPEYVQVFHHGQSAEAILNSLIASLADCEKSTYHKHMVDQIHLRETMGSFVFSDTICVPHPAVPVGKKAAIAIGIVPEGIAWDEEHPSIKLIFLLSPSYLGNQAITHMTRTIVRLIDLPQEQEELLQHPGYEACKKILIRLM